MALHFRLFVALVSTAILPAIAASSELDAATSRRLDEVLAGLEGKRVVFVGEVHPRYEHHLVQLAIIRRLHAKASDLAIGMEAFEASGQSGLDDYLASRIGERELLLRTRYFELWDYDFRLIAPILRLARKLGIPVVALASSAERVETGGSDPAYREHLKAWYHQHPRHARTGFERFYRRHLLRDEAMAACAARYLEQHPARRLVVLAGNQHLSLGAGVPERLSRRIEVESAIVVQGIEEPLRPGTAVFVLRPEERALPPAGRLGVRLLAADDLRIASVTAGSAAAAAGVQPGDRIVSLDGAAARSLADLKAVLWDRRPGDRVAVTLLRRIWFFGDFVLNFVVELGAPP